MTEEKKKPFESLGKATLRGVRKCPNCGTYNGTRGISCKNLQCRQVFKLPKEKIGSDEDVKAVKLVCSADLQIFSVKFKVIDDAVRCFVHLPVIEGIEALQDNAEVKVIKQSAAMCYAPSCRKPTDVGTITLNLNPCFHTQLVIDCNLVAIPLEIKKEVVEPMPIRKDIKDQIFSLVDNSEEHLVQRVTKNTMVVKCAPNDKMPLGFLHFSVFEPGKNSKNFKLYCECREDKVKKNRPVSIRSDEQKCFHFYLAVCAFASNGNLIDEFKNLIQSVLNIKSPDEGEISSKLCQLDQDESVLKAYFAGEIIPSRNPRKRNPSQNKTHVEDNTKLVKIAKKDNNADIQTKDIVLNPRIHFDEWLASVVERINMTMHYQFNGCPEPLIFHVPQLFFDFFEERISAGDKKRRLPNSITTFTKQNSILTGMFTKYTWIILNILTVKRIFDTTLMPLEITRTFLQNKDGTYVPYNPVQETLDLARQFCRTVNEKLIKPLELKTFLKVGKMIPDETEPTPFIIEWIPDILPKTHIGELRIKFEYGHERNGEIIPNEEFTDHPPVANALLEIPFCSNT